MPLCFISALLGSVPFDAFGSAGALPGTGSPRLFRRRSPLCSSGLSGEAVPHRGDLLRDARATLRRSSAVGERCSASGLSPTSLRAFPTDPPLRRGTVGLPGEPAAPPRHSPRTVRFASRPGRVTASGDDRFAPGLSPSPLPRHQQPFRGGIRHRSPPASAGWRPGCGDAPVSPATDPPLRMERLGLP